MKTFIKRIKFSDSTKETVVEYQTHDATKGATNTFVMKSDAAPSEEFAEQFTRCAADISRVFFAHSAYLPHVSELLFDRSNMMLHEQNFRLKVKGTAHSFELKSALKFETGERRSYYAPALFNCKGEYVGDGFELPESVSNELFRMLEFAVRYVAGETIQTDLVETLSTQELFDAETKRLKPAFDTISKGIDDLFKAEGIEPAFE